MNIKKLTLSAALALGTIAGSAHGAEQQVTVDQMVFCNDIANFTQAVAIDRDNGYTAEQLLTNIADADWPKDTAQVLANEVAQAFTLPHLDPELEGRLSFHSCIKFTSGDWL